MEDPSSTLCSTISRDRKGSKRSEKPCESDSFEVFFDSLVEGVSKIEVKERSDTLDTAETSESASTASIQPFDLDERTKVDSSEEDDWSWDSQRGQFESEIWEDLFDHDAYFLDETEFSRGLEGYDDDDEGYESGDASWETASLSTLHVPFRLRHPAFLRSGLAVIVEEKSFESTESTSIDVIFAAAQTTKNRQSST